MALKDNIGVFQYKILNTNGTVQVMVDLKFKEALIGPEHYLALKELFKNVVEKQTEKVVLAKISSYGSTSSSEKGR